MAALDSQYSRGYDMTSKTFEKCESIWGSRPPRKEENDDDDMLLAVHDICSTTDDICR